MPSSELPRYEQGLTFVGLIFVVVVLGAMTATAIVGYKSLNRGTSPGPAASAVAASRLGEQMSNGGSPNVAGVHTGPACGATAEAALSASNLYLASHGGSYPSRWSDLTTPTPPLVSLPTGATINKANPHELDGPGWKLVLFGGAKSPPRFVCG